MSLFELVDTKEDFKQFVVVKETIKLSQIIGDLEFKEFEDEISINDVNVDDLEEGVLILADGYRGELIYEAVVKYNGLWYMVDLVSDGVMILMVDQDCDYVDLLVNLEED